MGHRTFVTLGCVAMMFATQLASALGLGDITLRSSLNQPLVAEIQLLEVGDLTEAEILVGLASQEDFERVGVDRPFFLTDLRYQVRLGTPRGDVIVVTSRKPVREPYLNFIVQVRWPSGRLLREYTVLMDLPVFSDSPAGAVAPAESDFSDDFSSSDDSAANDDFVPRSEFGEQQVVQDDFVDDTAVADGTYGPVRANDTLWDIAAAARPDQSISIQQTMIAIQSLNPEAFINNNINLLKRGQVLRLPSRDQVRDISLQQANARVAAQNDEWTGGTDSAAQLDARNFTSTAASDLGEPEGRVKLSSPEDAFNASEGRGAGAGDSSTEALENELATTLEQLDKSNKENSELRSKIESLEQQIQTMERMVEVSNNELRSLELSIQKTKEDTAELAANDDVGQLAGDITESLQDDQDEALADEALSGLNDSDSLGSQSEDIATDEAQLANSIASDLASAEDDVAEQVATPTREPAKVISRPVEEKGIVDVVMDNIIFVLAGLLGLGVALFFYISHMRANRDEELEDDELTDMPAFDQPLIADSDAAEERPDDGFEDIDDVFAEDIEPNDKPEDMAAEPQTGDVASEADIYIAYGKYEQAAEMLNKALAEQPENPELHLKLLEVYANQQDVDAFDPQFSKLLALGVEEASERGHQLRSTISGVSDFGADDLSNDGFASDQLEIPSEDERTVLQEDRTVLQDRQELEDLDLGADLSDDDSLQDFDLEADLAGDLEGDLDLELGVDADETTDLEHELDLDLGMPETENPDLDNDLDLGEFETDNFGSEADLDLTSQGARAEEGLDFDISDEDAAASELEKELDIEFGLDLTSPGSVEDDELTQELTERAATEEPQGDETTGLDFDMALGDFDKDLDSDFAALDAELGGSLDDDQGSAELESLDLNLDTPDTAGLNGSAPDSGVNSEGLEFDISSLDAADAEATGNGSDEIDELLDLSFSEDSPEAANGAANGNGALDELEIGEDLDLSSLDSELEELTSGFSTSDNGANGSAESADDDILAGLDALDSDDSNTDNGDRAASANGAANGSGEKVEPSALDELDAENGNGSMFNQALTGVPDANLDFEIPEVDPDSLDDDAELDFLNDSDETATKLDLARAYIDMGDEEGAKDILAEIRAEGSEAQRLEADRLSQRLS